MRSPRLWASGTLPAAFAIAVSGAVGVAGLSMAPAVAEPANAHCGTSTGDTGTESWTDHDELERKLAGLEDRSKGRLQVDVVGESNTGRAIWAARVGTGDKVVLVQSEIHGNEKTGTEALLSLLRTMSGNSKQAQGWREEVTLVAVPKMNPDASELDRRANDRSWSEVVADFPQLAGAEPAWNYYTSEVQGDNYAVNPGFDVNRDFHPNLNYVPQPGDFPGSSDEPGWYIHPESQTIRDLYISLQDEFGTVDTFIDLHHQGPCYVEEGGDDRVTMSISGKFVEVANHQQWNNGYDLEYSKQLTLSAYDTLQQGQSPFSNITLYPQDIDLPGTALGSFALNGSGTVLFEVRGQTQSWGAKKRGQLIQTVERGLTGIIDDLADDAVRSIDADRYDDIPETDR